MSLRNIVPGIILCISLPVSAATWYVAANGNDAYSGSLQYPFQTIEKAISVVNAGDIIYVRGGAYNLVSTIVISKSGTDISPISLFAYTGETAVLDFSGQALDGNGE